MPANPLILGLIAQLRRITPASALGFPGPIQTDVFDNLTAVVDPGPANDNTQGYAPGSFWINTANNRVWMCLTNPTGAAVWLLDGVVPGVGVEPSSMLTQFGSSVASFPEEGNINRQISSAGVSPANTGSDYVIAVYQLPALGFDITGRGLQITAAGSFAANGDAKTIKLIAGNTAQAVGAVSAGGSTIATTGSVTTSGGGWEVAANIFKYGALGANTQIAIHSQAQVGGAVAALLAPSLLTLTENQPIYLAVTANTTTVTDVVFNWLEINAMN